MRFIKEKDKKQMDRLNLFGTGGLLILNFLFTLSYCAAPRRRAAHLPGRCFLFYLLLPYLTRVREVFAHHVKHSDHRVIYVRDIARDALDACYV